ncbi:hypothetical protein [Streptomyces sp. ODS28]|uniref:hypothetical protein n=1 Tax=Streptomyces sp. ODS28 TaxID=3136688 RepID=UPI0031EC0C82
MKGEGARMTLRVYRLAADGRRTPIRTVVASGERPFSGFENPGTYPPCQCPVHRGRT